MSAERLELREQPGGKVQLEGIASRVGVWYPMGSYDELIEPGAFKRSLASGPDVSLLVSHGDGGLGLPLARTRPKANPTLHLSETADGLAVRADLDPEDRDTADVVRKVRAGLVDAMSFAFQVMKGGQSWDDGYSKRRISAVNLEGGDVSLVHRPANPHTSASIRAGGSLGVEERRRRAELLGNRLTGAVVILRASSATCNRCGGVGTVTLACPTCSPDAARSNAPAPIKRGPAEIALTARLEQHLRNGPPGRSTGRVTGLTATELRLRVRAMQERERARRAR